MSDRGSSPRGGSERSRSGSPSPQGEAKAGAAGEGDGSPARQEGGDARRGSHSRSRSHSPAPAAGKGPAVDAEAANPGNNLYVANLPHQVSGRDGGWTLQLGQEELEEMFAKFGRVDKCEVIVDPVTRESSRDRGGYSRRYDDRDRGRYDDRDRGRGGYDRDRYDDGRRSRR
ncbi:hypothetical protein BBJ28_00008448 [Nothophytophthora sp. Chile5]|nr:hypothetical protein BBJ28_00008448 [Nothophytophthora sp. Chile5]